MKNLLNKRSILSLLLGCNLFCLIGNAQKKIYFNSELYSTNKYKAEMHEGSYYSNEKSANHAIPLKSYPETDKLYSLLKQMNMGLSIDNDSITNYLVKLNTFAEKSDCNVTKSLAYIYMAEFLMTYYQGDNYSIDRRTDLTNNNINDIKEWSRNNFIDNSRLFLEKAVNIASQIKDVPFEAIQRFTDFEQDNIFRYKNQNCADLIYRKAIDIQKYILSTSGNDYIYYLSKNDINKILSAENSSYNNNLIKNKDLISYLNLNNKWIDNATVGVNVIYNINRLRNIYSILRLPNIFAYSEDPEIFSDYISSVYLKSNKKIYDENKNSDLIINEIEKSDKPVSTQLSVVVAYYYLSEIFQNSNQLDNKNLEDNLKDILDDINSQLKQNKNNRYICRLKEIIAQIYSGSIFINVNEILPYTSDNKMNISYRNIKSALFTISDKAGNIIKTEDVELKSSELLSPNNQTIELPLLDFGDYNIDVKPQFNLPEFCSIEDFNEIKSYRKASFTVSSLFVYTNQSDDKNIFVITDSRTGKPVEGALLEIFEENSASDSTKEKYKLKESYKSNKLGIVEMPLNISRVIFYKVSKGKDIYYPVSRLYVSNGRYKETQRENMYNIFLDRATYRPGQTVYFKIFDTEFKNNKNIPRVNKQVEIILKDSQAQTIGTKTLTTDQFGAVWGEFILPENCLNGSFNLSAGFQSEYFSVADYKRPVMTINFDEIKQKYIWGENVKLSGDVETYSGAPLADATLTYDINYMFNSRFGESVNIGSGTQTTDNSGKFSIEFLAHVPFSDLFKFNSGYFEVNITVTDKAGNVLCPNKTIFAVSESDYFKPYFKFNDDENSILKVAQNIGNDEIKYVTNNMLKDLILLVNQGEVRSGNIKLIAYKLDKKITNNISDYFSNINNYDNLSLDSLIKSDNLKPVFSEIYNVNSKIDLSDKIKGGENYIISAIYDNAGKEFKNSCLVSVINENQKKLSYNNIDEFLYSKETKLQYGEKGKIRFGSSFKDVDVLCETADKNNILFKRFNVSDDIKEFDFIFKKEYGDAVNLVFSFVKDSKLYTENVTFTKKEDITELSVHTKTFRDKLVPGEAERWEFVIKNGDAPAEAQVLASMYDASLNVFGKNIWNFVLQNSVTNLTYLYPKAKNLYPSSASYSLGPKFNCSILNNVSLNDFDIPNLLYPVPVYTTKSMLRSKAVGLGSVPDASLESGVLNDIVVAEDEADVKDEGQENNVRKNLDETAFFYPNLLTDKEGNVVVSLTAPEALTEWDFNMLAVTKELQHIIFRSKVKTVKDFMVKPNMPTYIYDTDKINIPVIVSNLQNKKVNGDIKMELFNPYNNKVYTVSKKPLSIDSNSSTTVLFNLETPQNCELLGVRFIGSAGEFSDGEQNVIPVFVSKALVTESMSIYTEEGDNKFYFKSFANGINNNEKSNYKYIVEYCANPAWYAVKALPAIKDMTSDNIIEAIKSYYSNTLASYLATSVPEIKNAVELINKYNLKEKGFESTLLKNQELMNMLINQTPWILEANNESQNIESLKSLFDKEKIENNKISAINLINKLQNYDGGISYYQGMPSSIYLTLSMLDNFSRLTRMNAVEYNEREKLIIYNAIRYSDDLVKTRFEIFKNNNPGEKFTPSYIEIYWAYIRGYYTDIPLSESLDVHKNVIDYMRNKKKHSLFEMALYSLTFRNYGFTNDAEKLVKQLKKYSVTKKDKGTYWPNNKTIFDSNVSIISAHVMFMNAISASGADATEMNKLKQWLLTEKQAVMWDGVMTTLDAVYGILMEGDNWLKSDKESELYVGKIELTPSQILGSADSVFVGNSINQSLANISISQNSSHPGFGAAYWQYFQSYNTIVPVSNEVKISKELYKLVKENGVEKLVKTNQYNVGEVVVSRIVVTSDRDVSFVRIKDLRASCFAPSSYMSGYNTNGAVYYYEEIDDASTIFFIDYLPKGTFVFENKMYCSYSGSFVEGIATVQSMYLPQFVGNSRGGAVEVVEK